MGLTKAGIYTQEITGLASITKVLGHPARIKILDQISKLDGCVCGNLVNEIGLAQATVSQHLKELKNIGIIKGNIEGTSMCYCIDYKILNEYKKSITSFLDLLESRNNECC